MFVETIAIRENREKDDLYIIHLVYLLLISEYFMLTSSISRLCIITLLFSHGSSVNLDGQNVCIKFVSIFLTHEIRLY
jgi:hypothetical protein